MDVNLVLLNTKRSPKPFPLPGSNVTIGRRRSCDLHIPLMSISKKHCQLTCEKGTLKIRDLDSRNGTHVNGKKISRETVQAGDLIKIGPLSFLCQINGKPKKIKRQTKKLPRQNQTSEDTTSIQLSEAVELEDGNLSAEEGQDLLDAFESVNDDSQLPQDDIEL